VNESRVSQLHARAIRRLRDALGDISAEHMAEIKHALTFAARKPMAKVEVAHMVQETVAAPHAVVLPYKAAAKRHIQAKATLRIRPRQAVAAAR
jgi:hypothetical protein